MSDLVFPATSCFHCGKSKELDGIKLVICSRCKRARYCGPECQKASWPKHKPGCQLSAQGRATGKAQKEELLERWKKVTGDEDGKHFPRVADPLALQRDMRVWTNVSTRFVSYAQQEDLI